MWHGRNDFASPLFEQHLASDPPEWLFHYTSQNGLLGIVSNADLWATDINFMNDSMEFEIVKRIARAWLQQREFNMDNYMDYHIPAHADLLNDRQRLAISMDKSILELIDGKNNVCVICFCSDDDLLSQWRGYSGDAFGYCIGFKSSELNVYSEQKGFILGRCIYELSIQVKIVREICDKCLSDDVIKAFTTDEIVREFTNAIQMCGAFFKHYKFTDENEWRLVSLKFPTSEILFRAGKSMIVPYGKIPIGERDKSSLHSVRVGPCPHMGLSVSAVRLLSARYGMTVDVAPSSVPFRDW